MKILYENENGGVAIVHPTEEVLAYTTIDVIAKKDVPSGISYWVVEDSAIPVDRTFRDAWELDLTSLGSPYGVGGESSEFPKEVLDKMCGVE